MQRSCQPTVCRGAVPLFGGVLLLLLISWRILPLYGRDHPFKFKSIYRAPLFIQEIPSITEYAYLTVIRNPFCYTARFSLYSRAMNTYLHPPLVLLFSALYVAMCMQHSCRGFEARVGSLGCGFLTHCDIEYISIKNEKTGRNVNESFRNLFLLFIILIAAAF